MYDIVESNPVAKFYYQGTHSHPVRRTILVIETHPNYIRGYELRSGSTVRNLKNAPVRSYHKSRIAKLSQLGRSKHREPGPNVTSLTRLPLLDLLSEGA